ncbi:carboxymuconolactone decarboxylase family protein [Verrucomicrobia bacterium S94]|nr:carboxymuconolactone decarboxylase family protein [Verrucomicrobia bacterium S94]
MSTFKIHTIKSAPEESKPMLEEAQRTFGMVPNLLAVLAEAPGVLDAYTQLHSLFEHSSFNAEELTVVWQTINVEHECHYCVPAHTAIAGMMQVDPVITEALRNETELPTEKLQVLRETTLSLVRNRGRLTDDEMEAFFAAGYTQRQLLEVVLGLSQKIISNYVNHLAHTPVDEPFQKLIWEKKK